MKTDSRKRCCKCVSTKQLVVMVGFSVVSGILNANPMNGTVSAGSATITQAPGSTEIHQHTDRAVIDWQSFNINQGETTRFVQPSASSVALNRINPHQGASQIFGTLSANGQLILVNQAGIHFGQGATVDVAGLIATTANISNTNFMAGRYVFSERGNSGSEIVNEGYIYAANYGLVALVGNNVRNDGTIVAQGGSVIVAGEPVFAISFDDTHLVSFETSTELRTFVDGNVIITPATMRQIVDGAVNLSGVDIADDVYAEDGNVILSAHSEIDVGHEDKGGNILAVGNNTALQDGAVFNADSTTGKGGLIETSGNYLSVGNIRINTSSAQAQTGLWLLDPANVTIQANSGTNTNESFSGTTYSPTSSAATSIIDVDLLTTQLGNSNVTVTTTNTGTSGSGAGNITVADALTWSSSNTLTLNAARNIYLNADITATNGGLILNSRSAATDSQSITSGSQASPSSTGVTANLVLNSFNITSGGWYQVNATLPQFSVNNNFQLNSGNGINSAVSFIRAKGGTGDVSSPYQMSDIYGVQGIGSNATTLSKNYIMANNINAGGTSTWNGSSGFYSIGQFNNGATQFTGKFDGNNFTISNLNINRTSSADVGLFASTASTSIITNLTLTGTVAGSSRTGGLAGSNSGTISNVTSSINVTASTGSRAGGLVGQNRSSGSISHSSSSGNVTEIGPFGFIGGLAGQNDGAISYAYSSGTISFLTPNSSTSATQQFGGLLGGNTTTATLSHVYSTSNLVFSFTTATINYVGGLIGQNTATAPIDGSGAGYGPCAGSICSTGSITNLGPDLVNAYGGLVGHNAGGTISNIYEVAGQVSGNISAGGLVGINRGMIQNATVIASIASSSSAGGLVNYANVNSVISNSSASGQVSGVGDVGGLIARMNDSTASVSNSYSTATVNGSGSIGGFIGTYQSGGSVTNSYWNTETSGTTNNTTPATGLTTKQMMSQANYSSWDFNNTWGIIEGQSYPYPKVFFSSTPRVISGNSTIGANQTVQLINNGSALVNTGLTQGTTKTSANGFYYFVEPGGIIADNANLVTVSSSSNAYALTVAATGGASSTGSVLTPNTVTVGDSNTNTFSNSILGIFATQYPAVPLSVNASNLTIGTASIPDLNFSTNDNNTSYIIDGNISTYNNGTGAGSLVFNGPVSMSVNATISTGNSLSFLNAINYANNTLTLVNNAGSNTTLSLAGSTATQTWKISGTGSGTVTDGSGQVIFTNFQNLTGGTGTNIFIFNNGGTIAGNINGNSNTTSTLSFSSYSSPISVEMSSTDNYSGLIKNSTGNNITNYTNVAQINGNGLGTLKTANKKNTVYITDYSNGYVNDPFTFSGFNTITGQGQTNVVYNIAAILNTSTNQATINGQVMQFSGITNYSGNISSTADVSQIIISSSVNIVNSTETSSNSTTFFNAAIVGASDSTTQLVNTIMQSIDSMPAPSFGACH